MSENTTVSLARCDSYEYQKVRGALKQLIENLGGMSRYINPGERVLIKPNLLMKKKPEEATTTHPVVVQALASLLIEHGAKVIIGDSPGGPFTAPLINGVYRASGMEDAVKALGSGAALNSNFKSCERENPRGLILKRLTLTDMINDADKIISVAKLKTHAMMTYTGAVKNMFGTIPGIVKAEYHLNIPDYDHFADMLIDICLCTQPVLSFIDGIVGMEGHGPSAGTPVNTKLLLASPSPFHLDQAAAHIIGLNTNDVPVLKRLHARGMIGKLDDIAFSGEPIGSFTGRAYKTVSGKSPMTLKHSALPNFLKKFIGRHMQSRPVVSEKDCVGCAVCKDACPAKVIKITEKRKAQINHQDCIRCYCCQELCPKKAINVYKPHIIRMLKL